MKKAFYAVAFLLLAALSCTSDKGEIPVCDTVNSSYSQSIVPIMQSSCAIPSCHDGSSYIGNFSDYTQIKYWVDNGFFRSKVIDTKTMPPTNRPPLTVQEYNKIKCWLENGALNN